MIKNMKSFYRTILTPQCKGVYETYEMAKECIGSGQEYQDTELVEFYIKVQLDKNNKRDTEIPFNNIKYLLPLIFKHDGSLSVVDLGGNAGETFFLMKDFSSKTFGALNLQYTVVETEKMAQMCSKKLGGVIHFF